MKKRILNAIAIAVVALAIVSFTNNTAQIENNAIKKSILITNSFPSFYSVDTDLSTIEWKGFKPTGSHNGSIKLSEGSFVAEKNKLSSGTFTIQMSSLKEADGNTRLEGHLKSDAFFDIEKYPNANFKITGFTTKADKTMLIGDLTLKDKTNSIRFPVTVTSNENSMTLVSETFTIDRSKWNVRYGSKSFFDNLGDKFINDNIELKINISAYVAN